MDRRAFFGLLLAGVAVAAAEQVRSGAATAAGAAGAGPSRSVHLASGRGGPALPLTTEAVELPDPPPVDAAAAANPPSVVTLDAIPPPRPGSSTTIAHGPTGTGTIAITIDDGFCESCATFYVSLAQASGIHLTLSPNGTYRKVWDPLAEGLRPLIATGQVQIANHTFNHYNLVGMSNAAARDQINRNEDWIQTTFGITSRPWFRPPYGSHTPHTDALAGQLGFTRILMWNGSFGDSTPIPPRQIMGLAAQYLKPGPIMLGHANYTTIESLWDQIQAILTQRGLRPVTLDEMFGTTRQLG